MRYFKYNDDVEYKIKKINIMFVVIIKVIWVLLKGYLWDFFFENKIFKFLKLYVWRRKKVCKCMINIVNMIWWYREILL